MNIRELKEQLDQLNLSGACSLTVNGKPILAEAYGYADRDRKIANQIDTRFGTASIAKGFTAIAILQLAEQGRITLSTSVADLLPHAFPGISTAVTIEHLLTHTSGITDYYDEEQDEPYENSWNETLTEPSAYLPLLADTQMEFIPGSRFKYNNSAFVILSMLVEKVTKTPFIEHVTQHVLRPAGMLNSGYFRMDDLPPNTAIGYTNHAWGMTTSNLHCIPVIGGGDGGIYTTLADLDQLWQALASGTLLQQSTVAGAWQPHVHSGDQALYYGLGFWLVKNAVAVDKVFLMGSDPGVACLSIYYPENNAVISVLLNQDTGSREPFKLLEEYMLKQEGKTVKAQR